jgi:hypothetical protein
MTEIERLQKAILDLHGCYSSHVETVPVCQTFQGKVVWEGDVEVFLILNHLVVKKAYAWSYKNDTGKMQYVAVLHVPPVNTALDAVRTYIAAQANERH